MGLLGHAQTGNGSEVLKPLEACLACLEPVGDLTRADASQSR